MSENSLFSIEAGDLTASALLKVRNALELLTERMFSLESVVKAQSNKTSEDLKLLRSDISELRETLSFQHQPAGDSNSIQSARPSTAFTKPPVSNTDFDINSLLKLPICSPSTKQALLTPKVEPVFTSEILPANSEEFEPELELPNLSNPEIGAAGTSIRRDDRPESVTSDLPVSYDYAPSTCYAPSEMETACVKSEPCEDEEDDGAISDTDTLDKVINGKAKPKSPSFSNELDHAVMTILNAEDFFLGCKVCGDDNACECVDSNDELDAIVQKPLVSSSKVLPVKNEHAENEPEDTLDILNANIASLSLDKSTSRTSGHSEASVNINSKDVADSDQVNVKLEEPVKIENNTKGFAFGKPAFGTAPRSFSDLKTDETPSFLRAVKPGANPFAIDPKEHRLFSSPTTRMSQASTTNEPPASLKASPSHATPSRLAPTVTGEEGMTTWLETRCKLYQFFTKTDVRERGIGILKVLQCPQTGKIRVVMRREQVLIVCANFNVHKGFRVDKSNVGKMVLTWKCKDFSNKAEGEDVTFICKFKDEDAALVFEKTVKST